MCRAVVLTRFLPHFTCCPLVWPASFSWAGLSIHSAQPQACSQRCSMGTLDNGELPRMGLSDGGGWGVTCVSPGFQASVLSLGGTSACPATSRHHPSTPSQGRCSASFPGSRVSVVPAPEPLSQVPRCWEALIPGVSLRPSRLPLLLTPITGHQRPASEDRQSSPAVAALCWPRGKPG